MGCFYLAVIQAQLFCGSETWVISQHALKWLKTTRVISSESFHHRCACIIAHRPICQFPDGTWEHPPMDKVLNFCGLSDISTYIAWCKMRLLNQYAKPQSQLYSLCMHSTPAGSGTHCQMWWMKDPTWLKCLWAVELLDNYIL
jgi:hypothetical protein